jgi:hypothetical protein
MHEDVAASGGALATGGDAGNVVASGGAVPLVALDVPTTATVGDSAVSDKGPSGTVPLGTANPSSIVDDDVVHDKARLDEVALPDRAWPPPLCHTLMDAIAFGDAPNNVILNDDPGTVDKDSISTTLTAAGVDKDPHKVWSLCNSSTRGSPLQDIISPLAAAIAQTDAQRDILLESDVPPTAVSVPTALAHNPQLKSTLTFISSRPEQHPTRDWTVAFQLYPSLIYHDVPCLPGPLGHKGNQEQSGHHPGQNGHGQSGPGLSLGTNGTVLTADQHWCRCVQRI